MSVSVHPCTKLFIFLSYGYHAKAKALYLKPLFINENFSFSLLRTGNWCFFWPVLWIQIHRSWSRILAQFGSGSRVILSILIEEKKMLEKNDIFMCGSGSVFWIRIRSQKATEYGSNTDPDPQHCFWHNLTFFNFFNNFFILHEVYGTN